jgi:hypothetical protein
MCSAWALLLLAGLCVTALGAPQGGARYVSVVNLPLKGAPDGLSTTVSMLKYGDAVTVISAVIADSSAPVQGAGGKAKSAPAVQAPRWLRVSTAKGEGYVPEGSTVTDAQFNKQASGALQIGDTSGAGKGFSESEDPDIAAVKGAGGSAETGAANYPALDKIIAAKPLEDEQAKNRDFRQTGKLGEYKQAGAPR